LNEALTFVSEVFILHKYIDDLACIDIDRNSFLDKKARELVNGRSSAARDHGHHGGIGFPSLEGALLSLAFLTFAVFLIDLIQVQRWVINVAQILIMPKF